MRLNFSIIRTSTIMNTVKKHMIVFKFLTKIFPTYVLRIINNLKVQIILLLFLNNQQRIILFKIIKNNK